MSHPELLFADGELEDFVRFWSETSDSSDEVIVIALFKCFDGLLDVAKKK
jgi:hypothetical protein